MGETLQKIKFLSDQSLFKRFELGHREDKKSVFPSLQRQKSKSNSINTSRTIQFNEKYFSEY